MEVGIAEKNICSAVISLRCVSYIPSFNRYKQGIRCRWFMPGDINYLRKITSLKSISNMQKFHCILNWFYFNRNDYYDYYTFDDPLPALLATKRELINWLRKRLN